MQLAVLVFVTFFSPYLLCSDDIPCAEKHMPNQSTVCVCNSSYCDTITKRPVQCGQYVAYTTSKGGLRFHVTKGYIQKLYKNFTSADYDKVYWIRPSKTYQTIEGFGGAVTDSAGMLWKSLPEKAQQNLIKSYFSETGIEYNMIRVPIGGTDFSTHFYAYNELPINDMNLTNFTLSPEDRKYKIPMIKASINAAKDSVKVLASCWSPPKWMKTTNTFNGLSLLREEYFQTLADYYCKFIQLYERVGIPIWGVTTTNEPTNGVLYDLNIPNLGWTFRTMAKWITQNLGPTIRTCANRNTKILAVDDRKPYVTVWFNDVVLKYPKALDYIDGVAVHFYDDALVSPSCLTPITKSYPDKFIINTEASIILRNNTRPTLGAWESAQIYIADILDDLNYNLVGWIDWNMCLDTDGGPRCAGSSLDAAILVDAKKGIFYKQPAFYALGHFTKFLPRGSRRVGVEKNFLTYLEDLVLGLDPEDDSIDNVAFITPIDTMVVIIYNKSDDKQIVAVIIKNKLIPLQVEAQSITTLEFIYQSGRLC